MKTTDKSDDKLSRPQKKVMDALQSKGAYMMPPLDYPGRRTGYVTTGGLQGWICPVKLSTFNILLKLSLIKDRDGVYVFNSQSNG